MSVARGGCSVQGSILRIAVIEYHDGWLLGLVLLWLERSELQLAVVHLP